MAGKSLSAQKRMRQNIKRREANRSLKNEIKTYNKKFLEAINNNDNELASKLLKKYISLLDRAVKKNVLHMNNTNRKKSTAMKIFNSIKNKKKEKIKENA